MKIYPVRVPRDPYSGRNDARRRKQASFNDAAQAIERYLNQAMEAEPAGSAREFLTVDIARALHLDDDLADRVVFGIDCGHNGVTIRKAGGERADER
jgi:hypothetical protein